MTSSRWLSLALVTLLAYALTGAFPGVSSATFTSSTGSSATVGAASDWTPPTVALVSPGSAVKDVVTLSVQAADAESGVAAVTVEHLPTNGSTWTLLCTDTTAPYSCAWDTRALADGPHSLRARATDRAGHETTSATVRTTVANRLLVDLADPGPAVRGTVPLTATVHNAGTLSHTVRIEYAPSGTTGWKTLCTGLSAPYTCQWSTTGLAQDDYDLRAVLVAGPTTTVSALVEGVTVDNTVPAVSLADPGSPLSGSRTFVATATDAHSGVDRVVVQYAATGTSTWRDLCTVTDEPWSCRVATSTLPDGGYSFRAVATDVAGHSTTSAAVTDRLVDNTVASVSVEAPAALTGRVTLGATASSTAGIASVRLQSATAGSGAWTDLCTDTTSPYTCSWDTRAVPDGRYDLRAVMVDTLGRTTTSAVSAGHRVDNSPLRGVDVQTASGGSAAGRADHGDTVTVTFSTAVDTRSILAGWDGSATAVTVRLRDGGLLGSGSKEDTLDVLGHGAAVHLGSVNLKQDYVRWLRSAHFSSTMSAATVTGPQGVARTTVTLQLGHLALGGLTATKTVNKASTMVWSPSAEVLDLHGRAGSSAPVTETGVADREF